MNKLRFISTPSFFRYYFSKCVWNISTTEKVIYLTFDDGPIPNHTDFILQTLSEFNAKATFFCVGDNLRKFPAIGNEILRQGHVIGNHTFHHLQAWKTGKADYLSDVTLFEEEFYDKQGNKALPKLFRPPHGQLTRSLSAQLRNRGYHIVMWDILSYDFDQSINCEKTLEVLFKKTREGSIVVFHDNYKAERNLREMLPAFLKHFSHNGYRFEKLDNHLFN